VTDATELAAYRRARGVQGLSLFDTAAADADAINEAEPTARHAAAIASAEASALPGETALVERIQAMLRERHTFTTDTVSDYLDSAGVEASGPLALNRRRRLASRILNPGIRLQWWRITGQQMTTRKVRSGRKISVYAVTPTEGTTDAR
jgi:hypothetical protein